MLRWPLLVALSATLACAHRIPPLHAVEDGPPIRWPLSALGPLPEQADVDPLQLELGASGEIVGRLEAGPTVRYRSAPAATIAGTSLDRGYMKRFAWLAPGRIERYLEVFRGSPILSIFPRVHGGELPVHSFEIPKHLTQRLRFDGQDARDLRDGGPIILDPRHTKRPLVVMRAPDDSEGVLFFFPHRPEIRRWFLEDYTVTATLSAIVSTSTGAVEISFPSAVLPARSSFDFPIYVMPYRGTADEAVAQLAIGGADDIDYWNPRPGDEIPLQLRQTGLRMLRYFPTEFASWIDAGGYTYGHPGGFAWGDTTSAMKGVRVDPLDPHALLRDQAYRVLTFFIEAGREKGAPPNLMMHPQWTEQMRDPNEIRTIVFSQYWSFRLEEFNRWFDSPLLEDGEKRALYQALQAARRVFAPERHAFARATPNGGVWFEYLDLPISDREEWIANTHADNVGNVGEFARLARKMGRDDDYRWWQQLFAAGMRGLEYAIQQDWMWNGSGDPNELRYARFWNGPRTYHYYMLLVWVPRLAELAAELAPEYGPRMLALMRRLLTARFIAEDEGTSERARTMLAELEAKLNRDTR